MSRDNKDRKNSGNAFDQELFYRPWFGEPVIRRDLARVRAAAEARSCTVSDYDGGVSVVEERDHEGEPLVTHYYNSDGTIIRSDYAGSQQSGIPAVRNVYTLDESGNLAQMDQYLDGNDEPFRSYTPESWEAEQHADLAERDQLQVE